MKKPLTKGDIVPTSLLGINDVFIPVKNFKTRTGKRIIVGISGKYYKTLDPDNMKDEKYIRINDNPVVYLNTRRDV